MPVCIVSWICQVFAHFLGQPCLFLDLLLCVPEPLVHLVLLQIQLSRQAVDLFPARCLTPQLPVEFPKRVLLALRLASAIRPLVQLLALARFAFAASAFRGAQI